MGEREFDGWREEEEEGEVMEEMKSAAVLLYLRKHLNGGQ